MEQKLSPIFKNDPEGMLLRFVDDFLYINTDIEKVKSFLRTMYKGALS